MRVIVSFSLSLSDREPPSVVESIWSVAFVYPSFYLENKRKRLRGKNKREREKSQPAS